MRIEEEVLAAKCRHPAANLKDVEGSNEVAAEKVEVPGGPQSDDEIVISVRKV